MPSLVIIGAGQVGKTLGRLWVEKLGFTLTAVLNQSIASSQQAIAFILENASQSLPAALCLLDYSKLPPADLYLLTVPDPQIAQAAQALMATECVPKGALVVHCSGALPAETLTPLKAQGAHIASFHPVKSFVDPALSVSTFQNTYCTVEGDAAACQQLSAWLKALGGIPVPIEGSQKLLYHTALVIACNYLVTLTDVALKTLKHIGIKPDLGLQLLEPLMTNTLRQIMLKGTQQALTGPIARGDMELVQKQQHALMQVDPTTASLYELLAGITRHLLTEGAGPLSS